MRFISFCLFLLCPLVGHAQEFKKISCRFLSLNAETPTPPLLNVGDKGVEIPCTVHTEELSPAVACVAKDNTITFISSADRKAAATAKIPNTGKAFILIFVPAPKAPEALPWRVFVIEDSPANFPDAGAFVANFHNQEIRFILGEKKLMLKSGGAHGFASPTKLDSFNMAPVSFEFQQNGTWRVAKESMLRFLPGMRYLFFAYVDPTSGRPRISTFRDLSADSKANAAPEP
jgi:hypothetical protein